MQIGIVGLGKTGATLSRRLRRKGHTVVGYDPGSALQSELVADDIQTVESLAALAEAIASPRIFLLMVPPGDATDRSIDELAAHCDPGDVIIDGGHSNYKAARGIAERLGESGVGFVDLGLSGGVWALDRGYCLMVGGGDDAVAAVKPILVDLAAEGGYAHVGPVGAGHFLKMVHNGVECALMEAYGEGYELIESAGEYDFDLGAVDAIWRHGSIAHSWSLQLTKEALRPGSDRSEAERRVRVLGLRDRYESYQG